MNIEGWFYSEAVGEASSFLGHNLATMNIEGGSILRQVVRHLVSLAVT